MNNGLNGIQAAPASKSIILLPVTSLGVCLLYITIFTLEVAAPGFAYVWDRAGWKVTHVDECDERLAWCQANRDLLHVGDVITRMDQVSFDLAAADNRVALLKGFGPGDKLPFVVVNQGESRQIDWIMPPRDSFDRLASLLFILPIWLAGFVTARYLYPRDLRWSLLVLLFSLYSVWISAGIVSYSQAAWSSTVLHSVTWLLVAVFAHLHWVTPKPVGPPLSKRTLIALYGTMFFLAILEVFQVLPYNFFYIGILLQLAVSIPLLLLRLARRVTVSTTRLMLMGLAISVPGIFWLSLALVIQSPYEFLLAGISLLALTMWPLFYTYAIFRQAIGRLEPKVRTLITGLAFVSIYVNLVALGLSVIGSASDWPMDTLGTAGMAVALTLAPVIPAYLRFQTWANRTIYGRLNEMDLDNLSAQLAHWIPEILPVAELATRVADDVVPSLGVTQSALYMVDGDVLKLVYLRGGIESEGELWPVEMYVGTTEPMRQFGQMDWVHVALPLAIRQEVRGVWLLGAKWRDNFYSDREIARLNVLVHQLAVAVEISQLYTALQAEMLERDKMHRAIVQQAKMAALGEFAAKIAHEMMTRLQVILWSLQNLEKYPGDEEADEWLQTALRRVRETGEVVNQVRDFVKPSADIREQVNVGAVLHDIISLAKHHLAQSRTMVHTHIPGDLPPVYVARSQLGQVFTHLIVNACQAIGSGPGHLTVDANSDSKFVAIKFTDTGCGIPESLLDRIFEPLFTTKQEGTGLGLSVTHNIVKAYNGRIELTSVEGKGTTFTVTLPIEENRDGGTK